MVKSGNQITTNLLGEVSTTEKNGVEITIKNIPNLKPFNKALQYIVFFPNIYINGAEDAVMINSAKLKRFKNFAAASMAKSVPSKLLLGNVLYKCDKYHLSYKAQQFLNIIENSGIVIKFDVGEINITPNRESIIYSADTIKKIEDRIEAAKDELEKMIGTIYSKDYDNIEKYFNAITQTKCYDPVINGSTSCGYRFNPIDMKTCLITYNGLDLKKDINLIKGILSMTIPNYKGTVNDDKINIKRRVFNNNKIKSDNILILNKNARLLPSVKIYLKENYDKYSIMTDINQSEFEDWVNNEISSFLVSNSNNYYLILKGVYEALKAKAKFLDLETDKNFLSFKENLSNNKIINKVKEKEAILYVWNDKGYKEKKTFNKLSQAIQYIRNLKKGVIFTGMDADDIQLAALAELKDYVFIKARKDIVQDIKELNLNCIVDLNWLLHKDPLLSIVKTLAKHFPYEINTNDVYSVCKTITEDESKEFIRLVDIYNKYKRNYKYFSIVNMSNSDIDSYTEYLCLRLKNYINKQKEAKALIAESGCESNSTIITAVVMLLKGYRISSKAYNEVKNNKLIRILCRKF